MCATKIVAAKFWLAQYQHIFLLALKIPLYLTFFVPNIFVEV